VLSGVTRVMLAKPARGCSSTVVSTSSKRYTVNSLSFIFNTVNKYFRVDCVGHGLIPNTSLNNAPPRALESASSCSIALAAPLGQLLCH
jgi:hypothetical protein